jgi:ribonuclease HII
MTLRKLFCYVDETGQDTAGTFFLVSVIVIGEERDALRETLNRIEKESGKGKKKWTKTTRKQRTAYMERIIADERFAHRISFVHFRNSRAYVDMTILSTAKAIQAAAQEQYESTVYVDGMRKNEQRFFAAGLRSLHIRVRHVRGLTDQADAFIRLADAIAGFLRDAMEKDTTMQSLHLRAIQRSIVKNLKA